MIRLPLLLIILLFIKSGYNQIPESFLEELAQSNKHVNLIIAIDVNSNNRLVKCYTSNTELYDKIYLPYYKDSTRSFRDFIVKILSNEIVLTKSLLQHRSQTLFWADRKILLEYKRRGFDFIQSKYLNLTNGRSIISPSLKRRNVYTLIYILTKHNFTCIMDDYQGFYLVKGF